MTSAPPTGRAPTADPSLATTRLPGLQPFPPPGPGGDGALDTDAAAAVAAYGHRCRITAGRAGAETVWLDERCATGLPSPAGGEVMACGARGATRERRLRVKEAGNVVERAVVPWEAPFCLLEWEAADRKAPVELRWRVPPPASASGPLRWHAFDRGLVVAEPDDRRTAFVFDPAPAALRAEPDRDGGALLVRATIRPAAGSPVRLAIAAGDGPAGLDRTLRAASRAVAVVRGRQAKIERLGADRLTLATPDRDVDGSVERAKRLLAASSPRSGLTDEGLVEAIARLVIGEGPRVREQLGRQLSEPTDPRTDCLRLILLARDIAWTGDPRPAAVTWPRLEERLRGLLDAGAGPVDAPRDLRAVALAEMVHVAEAVGANDRAATLREAAGPVAAGAGTVRALRVVPGWARPIDAWRSVLAEPHGGRPFPVDAAVVESSPDDGGSGRVQAATATIVAAAFGLVGAEADATRGRLRLRPRPPAAWDRLAVRNLALGSAAVSVSMTRTGRIWRARAAQERGAAPLTLLLEPELAGRLVAARVDGREADLEPAPGDGRIRIPLQVVLDHERTIELEMEPEPR